MNPTVTITILSLSRGTISRSGLAPYARKTPFQLPAIKTALRPTINRPERPLWLLYRYWRIMSSCPWGHQYSPAGAGNDHCEKDPGCSRSLIESLGEEFSTNRMRVSWHVILGEIWHEEVHAEGRDIIDDHSKTEAPRDESLTYGLHGWCDLGQRKSELGGRRHTQGDYMRLVGYCCYSRRF